MLAAALALRPAKTQVARAQRQVPHTLSGALFDGPDITRIDAPPELRRRAHIFFGKDFEFPAVWQHPRLDDFGCRALAGRHSVFFAPGEFRPDTATGRRLLFHELAHAFQFQRHSAMHLPGAPDNGMHGRIFLSPRLEAEADDIAALADATATLPSRFHASPLHPACPPSAFLPVLTVGTTTYKDVVDICTPELMFAFHKAGLLDEEGEFRDPALKKKLLTKLVKWVNHSDKRWFGKAQGKVFDTFDGMVLWLKVKTEGIFKQNTATEKMLAEEVQKNTAINKALREIVTTRIPEYISRGLRPADSAWKPDSSTKVCKACGVTFSTFKRRHHCRLCGEIFCDGCTKNETIVLNPLTEKGREIGVKTKQRVCDKCFAKTPTWLTKTGRYSYFYCSGMSTTLAEGFNYFVGKKTAGISELAAFISDMAQATSGRDAKLFKVNFPQTDLFNARPVPLAKQAEEFEKALKKAQKLKDAAYRKLRNEGVSREQAKEQAEAQVGPVKVEKARRSDFNVDVNHPWVMKAIENHIPVGAGPSSTTNIVVQFIDQLGYPNEDDRDVAKIHVAMALFSFWRIKKSDLEKMAAIHTWNEVLAALQFNLSGKQWLQTDPEYDNAQGEPFFLYPAGFSDAGLPEYNDRHAFDGRRNAL